MQSTVARDPFLVMHEIVGIFAGNELRSALLA